MPRAIHSSLTASCLACGFVLLAVACAVDTSAPSDAPTGSRAVALSAAAVAKDDPKACLTDHDCAMIQVGCAPGAVCPGIGWIALNQPAAAAYEAAHRCVEPPAPWCPVSLLVWPFVPRCDEATRECVLVLPDDAPR